MTQLRHIVHEDNPTKIGLVVSSFVIIASVVPNISSRYFNIDNQNTMLVLFLGISTFMFFLGIKLNMDTKLEKEGDRVHVVEFMPEKFTWFSLTCFGIAIVFFLLAIATFMMIFL